MKVVFKKLASAKGASMIIALVFMMICVFIGGVVLVAASVNSGRLNGRREAQQALLNQRSIASVLTGALTNANGKLDLKVSLDSTTKEAVNNDGSTGLKAMMQSVFCECYNSEKEVEFTIQLPNQEDEEVNCYAVYENGGNIYVRFEKDSELQILFKGNKFSSYIKWEKAKIIKAT